ncbi:MAG: DUF3783 domain-containing protein [Lachnospiraceae bacterium]|nr:DUF3783 domain-containing protein [Lachnospiraceae bacterium]
MKETILLFQITDKKMKTALTTALLPLKIRVKQVAEEDYGKKLGILAGVLPEEDAEASAASADSVPLTDPMMILCGIGDQKLNRLLAALRSKNVRIPYKAMLTPTNQEWTPAECLTELKREHEAMTIGTAIHTN